MMDKMHYILLIIMACELVQVYILIKLEIRNRGKK